MIDVTGRLIEEAQRIASNVDATATALENAMRAEADAKRTGIEAKQAYEDAEAESRYEAMLNANGSNAEIRKAGVERTLMAARNGGELAGTWRYMLAAQGHHETARVALDMAIMRYKATCIVADLQAAMLRAVAR